jgi:DNA-binding transcriptional MerR regulator
VPPPPPQTTLTGIRTDAAAKLLGTNVNTLRSWERRFGFPKPGRTKSDHRRYELAELQALRDALEETGEIATAVEMAKDRLARASESRTVERELQGRIAELEGVVQELEGRLSKLEGAPARSAR